MLFERGAGDGDYGVDVATAGVALTNGRLAGAARSLVTEPVRVFGAHGLGEQRRGGIVQHHGDFPRAGPAGDGDEEVGLRATPDLVGTAARTRVADDDLGLRRLGHYWSPCGIAIFSVSGMSLRSCWRA